MDLLRELGVIEKPRHEQEAAVSGWLASNTPNKLLEISLRRNGFSAVVKSRSQAAP